MWRLVVNVSCPITSTFLCVATAIEHCVLTMVNRHVEPVVVFHINVEG